RRDGALVCDVAAAGLHRSARPDALPTRRLVAIAPDLQAAGPAGPAGETRRRLTSDAAGRTVRKVGTGGRKRQRGFLAGVAAAGGAVRPGVIWSSRIASSRGFV